VFEQTDKKTANSKRWLSHVAAKFMKPILVLPQETTVLSLDILCSSVFQYFYLRNNITLDLDFE